MNLRTRIKKGFINCQPWVKWKQELEYLPISSKTLFANKGIPIDIVEMELRSEKFIREDESLFDVLMNAESLKRQKVGDEDFHLDGEVPPDDWGIEDYEYFEENLGRI